MRSSLEHQLQCTQGGEVRRCVLCQGADVQKNESLACYLALGVSSINSFINYQFVKFRYYLFGYEFNTVELDSYRFAYRFD